MTRRAPGLPLEEPRAEVVVRGGDRRGRRARARDRVLPGPRARHHRRRRARARVARRAGTSPATRPSSARTTSGTRAPAIYEHSLKLWEGLEEELGYDLLFSQRGVLNLAHSLQDVRESARRVNANRLNGIDAEWLEPDAVAEICPILNVSPDIRYPVLGATLQRRGGIARHENVAWGYARAADALGVDLIQGCEVTGIELQGGRAVAVETSRGRIAAGRIGARRRGAQLGPRGACRPAAAGAEPSAPGARLGALRAGARHGRHVERRPCLRQPGPQGRARDGRRNRLLQLLCAAGLLPRDRAPAGRGAGAVPALRRTRASCAPGPASSTSARTPRRSSA